MEQGILPAFELYLSRQPLRAASVDIKRRACRFFVETYGRPSSDPDGETRLDLPVGEVTPAMAEDFRTILSAGRSQSSVNSYLNNFRPFWTWLSRHGHIRSNPFAQVGPVEIDEQAPRQTFTPAELGRLVKISSPLWRIRICLGLMGCRRGEMLLGIQARDVRLDEDPAHIIIGYRKAGPRTVGWGVKGKKVRYVGVPDRMGFDGVIVPLRQLIAERIAELGHEDGYVCLESKYVERLLAAQRDGTVTWNDLRDPTGNFPRFFRSLQGRADIRHPRRFHELRAAFATSMIDQFGLSRAADLLGHSSVETTRKYDRKTQLSLVAEAARVASQTYVTKVS